MSAVLKKQPSESYTIGIEYDGKLPAGSTLTSGSVSAVDYYSGQVVSGTILGSTSATISGTQAKVLLRAGTSGRRYKVTFETTLDSLEVLEDDIIVDVVEE